MNIFRAWHLAHKSVTIHKKRSFMTALAITVVLTIVIFSDIFTAGMKETIDNVIEKHTEDRLLLASSVCREDNGEACYLSKDLQAELVSKAIKYNGVGLGKISTYRNEYGDIVAIANKDIIGDYIELDDEVKAKDSVSVVVSINGAESLLNPIRADYTQNYDFNMGEIAEAKERVLGHYFDNYKKYEVAEKVDDGENKTHLYVVGIAPRNDIQIKTTKRNDDFDLFDTVIINPNGSAFDFYLIGRDDSKNRKVLSQYGFNEFVEEYYVSEFRNVNDAKSYYTNESCDYLTSHNKRCNDYVKVFGVFPNKVDLSLNYDTFYNSINIMEVVLIVSACLIAFFTFIRVIDQEKNIIALYYSLGAKKRDVCKIYLLYLAEIILCALIISTAISVLGSLIIWSVRGDSFMKSIEYNFGYIVSSIEVVHFNLNYYLTLVLMLSIAPISIVVSLRTISQDKMISKIKNV
ncbi:ABC transporter permease [Candidatus Saccharibacteria bacterium]|nr:ABC transporter permease [Candidatus Saccharibacteria bacterium]